MLKRAAVEKGIRISELATAAGVHVETIRYYQSIALLRRPRREHGRIGRYDSDDLKRLRFIKRAQALGFSLDEVAILLGLAQGEHCAETKALAEKKLSLVKEKIRDLGAMRDVLQSLVNECARECAPGGAGRGCPIIDALAQDTAEPFVPH